MPDPEKSPEAKIAEEKPIISGASHKEAVTGIEPLLVTLIGTRTENSGAPIVDGQEIVTPDHQPNLIANVIPPIVAVIVRALNVFLNALLGGLGVVGAGSLTGTILWATWQAAAVFASSAALVNIVQSLITIFGDLEKKHPLLTGSV